MKAGEDRGVEGFGRSEGGGGGHVGRSGRETKRRREREK
jgi:hypothetical protein